MKNFSWAEKAKGTVTVTTPSGDGVSSLMAALVAVMAELIIQPKKDLWEAVGWIDWPFKEMETWPIKPEIENFFRDLHTLSRVYNGFTQNGVSYQAEVVSDDYYEANATMTWWGYWTPGRMVSLELKPGSATLSWDSGTEEKSSFIFNTIYSFFKDVEEEIA